jgi:hypothetical protein
MTNDTLPSLTTGQDGIVTLGYMGMGASKTKLSEIACH